MIWTLFEALIDTTGAWAFTYKNGEFYLEEVKNLPAKARIIG
jgi:hypothetical protein